MNSTAIRILLALSMALWSPAWCCCALRTAAATLLDETCEIAVEAGCCSREPSARSCCDDDESPCRCSERPSELNRLDTAPKLAVPKLVPAPVAVVISNDLDRGANRERPLLAVLGHGTVHPPPRTLLAQSCLLLI